MSCGVGGRRSSDPALLWPWCRPVASAPIRPLAWETTYAAGAAQEMAKRKKKKIYFWPLSRHVEVPGPGIKSKLQLWQDQVLEALRQAGD